MGGSIDKEDSCTVLFVPPPQEGRRSLVCPGVTAEIVSMLSQKPFDSRRCGPFHLLIAHERLTRHSGVTTAEGLPASNLQNLSRTFTFVPAGCQFRERHDPDMPSRTLYIHIDPHAAVVASDTHAGSAIPSPRVHFQCDELWQTVPTLQASLEEERDACSTYANALGVVLVHELLGSQSRGSADIVESCGGGSVGQRRLIAHYVEDRLTEPIPVARLAELARLSRFHFCRSFRRAFGISPHRYHSIRKMERAKVLLANPETSVTNIALDNGFHTPSGYRRALARKAA